MPTRLTEATDIRVDTGRTVHVIRPVPGTDRVPTACGRTASGLLWWPDMPVTSTPPAFTSEPPVSCPDCLAVTR